MSRKYEFVGILIENQSMSNSRKVWSSTTLIIISIGIAI